VTLVQPAAAESSAPEPAALQLPPELALANPACSVRGRSWRAPAPLPLRTSPRGVAFADAWAGQADIAFGEGPLTSALLRVEAAWVALVGWVDGPGVRLWPARPLLVAGFASPKPRAALVPLEVAARRLRVTIAAGPELELDALALRGETLACADVSLDALPFDPRAALPDAGAKGRTATLRASSTVPLSTAPADEPVARLRPSSTSREVSVLASRGGKSRIVWELDDVWVVGWVDTSALGPPRPRAVDLEPPAAVPAEGAAAPAIAHVACPNDVPLVAGEGSDRSVVGVAHAGSELELTDRGVGYRHVRVTGAGFRLSADKPLSAREVDLAPCRHVVH